MTLPPRPTPITAAGVLLFAYAGQVIAAAAGLIVVGLVDPPWLPPVAPTGTPLLIFSAIILLFGCGVIVHAVEVLRGTKENPAKEGTQLMWISAGPVLLLTMLTATYLLWHPFPRPGLTLDRDTLLVFGTAFVWLTSAMMCVAGWLLRRHAAAYHCWA